VMHFLPKNTTILYRGPLPHEQVMLTLGIHHIFVLPSKAENFGHAIFEALSAGRPVLISDKTPWRKLREEQVGWDLALDDHKGWIAALKEAAEFDQSVFNDWSDRCRRFARNHQEETNLRSAYIQLFS
jgi:glycosyltransferase involved in cell wall biosynthesis